MGPNTALPAALLLCCDQIDLVVASLEVGVRSHQLVAALQQGYYPSDRYPVLVELVLK
jgi:hypothetical protein